MMGRVYSQAMQVKIWLGPEEDGLMSNALQLLKQRSNLMSDDSDGRETLTVVGGFGDDDSCCKLEIDAHMRQHLTDPAQVCEVLKTFFSTSWFRRLWVLQKIWYAEL